MQGRFRVDRIVLELSILPTAIQPTAPPKDQIRLNRITRSLLWPYWKGLERESFPVNKKQWIVDLKHREPQEYSRNRKTLVGVFLVYSHYIPGVPCSGLRLESLHQCFQQSSIQEYASSHIGILSMAYGIYFLSSGALEALGN